MNKNKTVEEQTAEVMTNIAIFVSCTFIAAVAVTNLIMWLG